MGTFGQTLGNRLCDTLLQGRFSSWADALLLCLQPGCMPESVPLHQQMNKRIKDMCECCNENGHGHAHGEGCHAEGGRLDYVRLGVSALLLFAGLVMDNGFSFFSAEWMRTAWYVAAYLPVGLPVMARAVKDMVHGDVCNEFTLMSIASIGAFAIGECPEGVAVMLF